MIDLHNHIVPEIDDGAASLDVSLAMAQMWLDDGVTVVAATPHILPGLYPNSGAGIRQAVEALQVALALKGLPLQVVAGADNHIVPGFVDGLRSGHLLPLAGSRYVLVEPPHHVCPPRIDQFFFDVQVAGYVPVLTHPERLSWIEGNYEVMQNLARKGVWMQITAGSLIGAFGRQPRYWAERMLDEGLVHILASDAHGADRRPPLLRRGFESAERRIGVEQAHHLVKTRPQGILDDIPPQGLPMPLGLSVSLEGSDVPIRSETGAHPAVLDEAQGRLARRAGPAADGFAQRLRRVFAN